MNENERKQIMYDINNMITRTNHYLTCHAYNYLIAQEEYKMVYYDKPIVDKEIDGKRYLLYEAWGIPASEITYEKEFINKTKDMYLNVQGKAEDINLGFENNINVRLHVDTNIYDGFEVSIDDGMVKIILYEIKNEEPVFKDLSI